MLIHAWFILKNNANLRVCISSYYVLFLLLFRDGGFCFNIQFNSIPIPSSTGFTTQFRSSSSAAQQLQELDVIINVNLLSTTLNKMSLDNNVDFVNVFSNEVSTLISLPTTQISISNYQDTSKKL